RRPPPSSPLFPSTTLFRSPVGVTQLDEVAVAVIPAGDRDDAVGCRADRRAVRGRVIRAFVRPPALQNRMIAIAETARDMAVAERDRKSTRLDPSHQTTSSA